MRILVVAATSQEIAPAIHTLTPRAPGAAGSVLARYSHHDRDLDVLLTGVGMVAAAAWTARALSQMAYDVAVNAGVCGSFSTALPPGTVVHVVTDRIAELGAEDSDRFLTIEEIGLPGETLVVNDSPPASAALGALPRAHGITVNTVHGRTGSIAEVVARFHPEVETMEGAGFMHACRISGVSFAQVRAVSNVVEARNRAAWRIDEAIAALNRTLLAIIEDL